MHPEDIKAQLRKKFGSVFAFEDAVGLPRKSVTDALRGRRNQRVWDAISKVIPSAQSDLSDCSNAVAPAHGLNEVAK